jgi:glutathione peroxidase
MWNFHKYLIGRDGKLVSAFGATSTPESSRVVHAIEAELAKPERQ